MNDSHSIPERWVSANRYLTGKDEDEDRVALVLIWRLAIARGSQVNLLANPALCHDVGWHLTEAVRRVIGGLQRAGIGGAVGDLWRRNERDVALFVTILPLAAKERAARYHNGNW